MMKRDNRVSSEQAITLARSVTSMISLILCSLHFQTAVALLKALVVSGARLEVLNTTLVDRDIVQAALAFSSIFNASLIRQVAAVVRLSKCS